MWTWWAARPTLKWTQKTGSGAKLEMGRSVVIDGAQHEQGETALRVDGREQPVTPGMAVTAEIKTGRRRVIDYLLAPLCEYVRDRLRER